jgi:hypothetical protein
MHGAAVLNFMDDSSPLRIHSIPQEQFLPLSGNLIPDYRSFSVTQSSYSTKGYTPDECPTIFFEDDMDLNRHDLEGHDQVFLKPPDLIDSLSFYSPEQVYPSDGPHDISEIDMGVPDEAAEGVSQLFEYAQDMGGCEHSDVVLEPSLSYQGSSVSRSYTTTEAYDDTLRPFLEGRAMLLGISPYVPLRDTERMSLGNGLLSAEVDVAKHLKDHWRPHRL